MHSVRDEICMLSAKLCMLAGSAENTNLKKQHQVLLSQCRHHVATMTSQKKKKLVATMIIMVDQNKSRVCIKPIWSLPITSAEKAATVAILLTETVTGTNHSHLQIPAGSASN